MIRRASAVWHGDLKGGKGTISTPSGVIKEAAFTDVARDPFFAKGQAGKGGSVDYHIPLATKLYLERNVKIFDHWKSPANSQVYAENIWGKAMARTNVEKWPADKFNAALDEHGRKRRTH